MSASREKNKRKEQAQNVTPEVKNEKKGMSKGELTSVAQCTGGDRSACRRRDRFLFHADDRLLCKTYDRRDCR